MKSLKSMKKSMRKSAACCALTMTTGLASGSFAAVVASFDANFESGVNLTPTAANTSNLTGSLVRSSIGTANGFTNAAGITGNALILNNAGANSSTYQSATYNYTASQLGFDTTNGMGTNSWGAVFKLGAALPTGNGETIWSTGIAGTKERIMLTAYDNGNGRMNLRLNTQSGGGEVSNFPAAYNSNDTSNWYYVGYTLKDVGASTTSAALGDFQVTLYLRQLSASGLTTEQTVTGVVNANAGTFNQTLGNPTIIGARSDSLGATNSGFTGLIDQVQGFSGAVLSATDFRAQYWKVVAPNMSWSNAGSSSNLGGSGTWDDTTATKWFVSTENSQWVTTAGAVFSGSAGTVTVSGTQTVGRGLTFSTTGYALSGGEIKLNGGSAALNTITTDSGVSATISSALSGTNGLTKAGTGTLTLSGSNSYSGATQVTAGTLVVNSTLGNGGITVGTGATLKGNLTAGGTTTIQTGGLLAVGNSPGTGNFATLTLAGTTEMEFNANAARNVAGTDYDTINSSSALTYGGDLKLVFAGAVANDNATTFDLFSFGSLIPAGDFSNVNVYAGLVPKGSLARTGEIWTGTVDLGYGGGNQTFRFDEATGNLAVIPEPAGLLLVGLTSVLLLRRRDLPSRRFLAGR